MASFLGLCNYYRILVPLFADLIHSLYEVSRQKQIEWTEEMIDAFEKVKERMLTRPIVRLPNPQEPFILETDASTVAVGAVLKQLFEDIKLEHPVGFFSRALTGSERNYSVYELEMYAIVRSVEWFRIYLLGREFLLRTDHRALVNLFQRDLPLTTRLQKWILRLSEYTFRIEHQRGKDNVIADALSRLAFGAAQQKTRSKRTGAREGANSNRA